MIALYVCVGIVGFLLVSYFPFTMLVSKLVFDRTLKRRTKDTWGRQCSILDDEDQVLMFNEGMEWAEKHKDKKIETHIVNECLNLYGEFFDFGF